MRIGIDAYPMQDPASAERGIGRYARDLTRALIEAAPEDEFLLYAVKGMDTSGIPNRERIRWLRPRPMLDRFCSGSLASAMPGNPDQLDALLVTSPLQSHAPRRSTSPRLVSVVYDLIPETLPGVYCQEPAYQAAYERYLAVVRDYDAILTMSSSARDDLVRLRQFDPGRIIVAGAGANPAFGPAATAEERAEDQERLRALGLFDSGFVLNVGHEDPRKGSRVLAEAFARLPEEVRARRLVFAYNASPSHQEEIMGFAGQLGMPGASGDPELLHELGMLPQVHFTGWCDDLSLRALYRNAAVMVFPSLYEGFGLPILEAMRCGCPVIVGANSSQPEVCGEAGIVVDAADPVGISEALGQVLGDVELAGRMGARGLELAERFSWDAVAARALAAIRGA